MTRQHFKQMYLSETDFQILETLSRLHYATTHQLVYWLKPQRAALTKAASTLARCQLINIDKTQRPYILSLTRQGRRVLGLKDHNRRYVSWSVMAHQCHRNEVEIRLRDTFAGFTFQSREYCYKKGLNPAHGEHAAKDKQNHFYFLLLDDYLMGSERITHAWLRQHTPRQHWPGDVRHWSDVADQYIVTTTSIPQLVLHRAYALKHQINAQVICVDPLWRMS